MLGNLKEVVLFTYSTKHLDRTEKVKLHYHLKGRNGNQGVLEKIDGRHIGSTVLLIPKGHESTIVELFKKLKIQFEQQSIFLENDKET